MDTEAKFQAAIADVLNYDSIIARWITNGYWTRIAALAGATQHTKSKALTAFIAV